MAIVAKEAERRIVLSGIAWSTYEALLADLEHSPGTRLTYNRGELEIMSPSDEHERLKTLIARMIEVMTEELDIPIRSAGSTTFKSEPRMHGLEPDECYYVANEPRIRGRDEIDLSVDPPPDLAIEVEISSNSMEKLEIYADLEVPEVWRCDGTSLRVWRLQPDGTYAEQSQSGTFPFLPLAEVERFLAQRNASDETTWIRAFRAYVKELRADK